MVRPLNRDILLLSKKSRPASRADLPSVQDLIDTLDAHADTCVGMACNMIGVHKRILVYKVGLLSVPMLNPKMVSHSAETYLATEGCLCLDGVRNVTRYKSITVEYQDISFRKQQRSFTGISAQIIQHEMDHFEGIII